MSFSHLCVQNMCEAQGKINTIITITISEESKWNFIVFVEKSHIYGDT